MIVNVLSLNCYTYTTISTVILNESVSVLTSSIHTKNTLIIFI